MKTREVDDRGHAALWQWRNEGGQFTHVGEIGGSIIARVTYINWAKHTINCMGDGRQKMSGPWVNVPVMSPNISQKEGIAWIPNILEEETVQFEQLDDLYTFYEQSSNNEKNNVYAVILFIGDDPHTPVCIGFIVPNGSQMTFEEPGVKIERHTSNIYTRTTKNGTYEHSFPDGTYIKLAQEDEPIELTSLEYSNADSEKIPWTIEADSPRYIYVKHSSGTSITIDAQGNVAIESLGSVSVKAENVDVSANSGDVTIGNISLVSHTHLFDDAQGGGQGSITHSTYGPQ